MRLALPPANGQVLRRLHEQGGSRNHSQLPAQLTDHLIGSLTAFLSEWLQGNEHASLIQGGVAPGKSDNGLDVWVLQNNVHELGHLGAHGRERNILRRLHGSGNTSRILLREEAFGNDDVQIHREASRRNRHHTHHRLVTQNPLQAEAIDAQHSIEYPLAKAVPPAVLLLMHGLQQL